MVILPVGDFKYPGFLKVIKGFTFIGMSMGPVLVSRQALNGAKKPLVVGIK